VTGLVVLPLVALLTAQGELEVTSHTEGARIFVDGKLVGECPLRQPLVLSSGQHTLKLTKRGYTDFLDVVVVRSRRKTPVVIDLLPVSGVLHLQASVSGARVFVDGKFVGESAEEPLEVDLAVGKRSVRVEKGGYRDYLGTVEAVAGEVSNLRVDLAEVPIGTSPFRPRPPPPPKWYDHWYVWTGGALAVVALTMVIVIPLTTGAPSNCTDLHGDLCYDLRH
jgi:hypothetical protein